MKLNRLVVAAIAILSISNNLTAQDHQLVKKWETDTTLKVPESVLFDATNNILYTSNIGGGPSDKNGKGSIGKVGTDGKVINAAWVTGLNAPKGLGLRNNMLWVADVDELVAINIKSGKIEKKIKVEGAAFLNDVTIDKNGVVYVSDSRTKKVHKVENDKVTVFLENLQGPNGLLAQDDKFYVLDAGALYRVDANKTLTKLAEGMEGGTDGIEQVQENEFVVSCWGGVVYYVKADGSKQTLLDTRNDKINSADIGYDAKNRIVYVPTFFKNNVVAYELK
jgi:sugar lactone lactonase YvrE